MIYTKYAARTGKVIGIMTLPDDPDYYDANATLLHEGEVDGTTHYFVAGVPIARPSQTTTVDVTEINVAAQEAATLGNLPGECIVTITGPEFHDVVTVTDGTLEFSAMLPGDYSIRVEAFPYLPFETIIHAVQGASPA